MTEIFIEPELQELSDIDNSTEWQIIAEELNLGGQLAFTEKSETKQAPPYMFVDPKTDKIIRILCPRKEKIENYKASTIPLDVLREVHKCKEHGWYEEICVYYDDKSPDPFVVGFTPDKYSWQRNKHLIARWGNELLPFEELEIKAINRMKDAALQALYTTKSAIDFAYNNVEAFCKSLLTGKESPKVEISVPTLNDYNRDSLPF